MPEHPKGGRRHPRALTFRGLLMWGGTHLCMDSSCPCCSRTTAAVDTWGLPTTAFRASTKLALSLPCRGETRWQGHSKIPGATWLAGRGSHCL